MSWSQIFFDDINTTFTINSSVAYKPMPGSSLYTGEYNNINCYKPEKANTTSARFVVGNEGCGIARVQWGASFTGDAGNQTYHIAIFRNGSKVKNLSAERKLGTAGDIGNANAHGFVSVTNNDYLDIRANADGTTGVQVTFNHLQMNVQMVTTSTVSGTVV